MSDRPALSPTLKPLQLGALSLGCIIGFGCFMLLMLAIAPWLYVGFDTLPQAAEEFDFSPRQVSGSWCSRSAPGPSCMRS